MLISGIGIDIVDVNRIEKIAVSSFAQKILSEKEIKNFDSQQLTDPLFLAFVFSAKEAVAKANGTGFSGIWFKDIELHFEKQYLYAIITKNCAYKSDTKFYIKYDQYKDDNNSKLYIISKCIASDKNINPNKLFDMGLSKTCSIENIDEVLLSEDEKNIKNESKIANIVAKKIIFNYLDINDYGCCKKVTIARNTQGSPKLICNDKAINEKLNGLDLKLSLSHEKEIAVAFLAINKRDDNFEQYI